MTQIVEKLVKISATREKMTQAIDHMGLIRTALDLLACQIEREKIAVHLHAESPHTTTVHGNPSLLLQALLAILHRACTSFPPDLSERWIRIVTQASDESLRIIIEDNGDGFQEYDRDAWLDPLAPFEALDHGLIFNYTIPRNIIHKHHGTLTLEPPMHRGKRVIVDLPLINATTPAETVQSFSMPSPKNP